MTTTIHLKIEDVSNLSGNLRIHPDQDLLIKTKKLMIGMTMMSTKTTRTARTILTTIMQATEQERIRLLETITEERPKLTTVIMARPIKIKMSFKFMCIT